MPARFASRSRVLVGGLLLAVVAVATGCSSTPTTNTDAGGPATTVAPSYATVADLAKQLEAKGIACKLEYEGLKQEDKTLSLCVIGGGEQATLTIWDQPEVLGKFLATPDTGTGATAVGANWTIDVDTAATAHKLTDALGGQVKAAAPTSPRSPGSNP
jgi:hypothetical protein